jgi:hypothetical protein
MARHPDGRRAIRVLNMRAEVLKTCCKTFYHNFSELYQDRRGYVDIIDQTGNN